MADTRTRSSGLFRWTSGIVTLVAAFVLIVHFTRPAPARGAIAPTELDGFVADATSRQLLRNSLVTITLGDYSAQLRTDTFGRYAVVFPSPNADASVATVHIETAGYQVAENKVSLRPGNNYAEIMLTSNAGLRPVAASPDYQSPPGQAKVVLKSLPSDFMKASKTYAVTGQK
jgi:hypothetical protein